MIYYQIISGICFVWFIVNIAFLMHLYIRYTVPKNSEKYMFFSILKNVLGAITQLYALPYGCNMDWYIKSFTFAVCLASFNWCLVLRKISIKK